MGSFTPSLLCLVLWLVATCASPVAGRLQGSMLPLALRSRSLLEAIATPVYHVPYLNAGVNSKLAVMSKYEEGPNPATITSNARAMAFFYLNDFYNPTSINYAVVAPTHPADALTAETGADVTGLHMHVGAARMQNSSNIYPLMMPTESFMMMHGVKVYSMGTINDSSVMNWTNTLNISNISELWQYILQGNCYCNIHTTMYPAGEIRGQIDWAYDDLEFVELAIAMRFSPRIDWNSSAWMFSFLSSAEETNKVKGDMLGTATAAYVLNSTNMTILYEVVGPGLNQTTNFNSTVATQLHIGALRGQDSSAIVPLVQPDRFNSSGDSPVVYAKGGITMNDVSGLVLSPGGLSLTLNDVMDLWMYILNGSTYTNIITTSNPSGEMRGQNDWNNSDINGLVLTADPNAITSFTFKRKGKAISVKPVVSFLFGAMLFVLFLA